MFLFFFNYHQSKKKILTHHHIIFFISFFFSFFFFHLRRSSHFHLSRSKRDGFKIGYNNLRRCIYPCIIDSICTIGCYWRTWHLLWGCRQGWPMPTRHACINDTVRLCHHRRRLLPFDLNHNGRHYDHCHKMGKQILHPNNIFSVVNLDSNHDGNLSYHRHCCIGNKWKQQMRFTRVFIGNYGNHINLLFKLEPYSIDHNVSCL